MHEQGSVAAIAAHDPKQLSQFAEPLAPPATRELRDWFDAYERPN